MNMGVETLESELVHVSVEKGSEGNGSSLEKENVKLGTDESNKTEANLPTEASDEWPADKKIYSYYMVKYRSYEDKNLKVKLDHADAEIVKLNQARTPFLDKLKAKRAERGLVIDKLKVVIAENQQFRQSMDVKRKEMEPLQQALVKFRGTNTGGRIFICDSEAELNDLIKSLEYRIQHESIPLTEEKKILKEIKQLEGTRAQVVANDVRRAKLQESVGKKEDIQDQVKLIGVGLDGVRKDQKAVWAKKKQLEDEKKPIQKVIDDLQYELDMVTAKRDKAIDKIVELRKQRANENAPYYNNRVILNDAKKLAAKKDIEGLAKLVDTEVNKFISLWSSSKAFRDDYERRILWSLDSRQLSRDGRMRNPDEKPLVVPDPPTPAAAEISAKPNLKSQKEKSSTKQQKEENNDVTGPEGSVEQSEVKDKDVETVDKIPVPKTNEVDEVKLKELKREEEMAKAKQALERKKKLADKAAAKAAIKSQKNAEKKLKKREKKEKKKAAGSGFVAPEEPTETADEVAEPEKAEEIVEEIVPAKNKESKDKNTLKRRGGRAKGQDALPKMILKRKKATNYWVWAVPAALVVMLLAVIGYNFLL